MTIQVLNPNDDLAPNDKTIEQFKSIYYLLKGKRDTDIKLLNGNKQFKYEDIIDLNRKIFRKLELHQLVTHLVTVTIGLDNKEIKTFGNWNEFTQYDRSIPECTKYLNIEWDFNIVLPHQIVQVPQTHTVRVRIGNGLKPNEMIQVIFQGDDEYDIEEASSQAVCKIDFVNAQICTELKNVVSLWYDSLQKNSEEQMLIPFLIRISNMLSYFIIILFLTAGVILINYLVNHFVEKIEIANNKILLEKFFLYCSYSLILLYSSYIFGRLFSNFLLRRTIDRLRRNPMFE